MIFLKIVLLEMYPPILLLDDYFLFQTSKTHNDLRRERLSQWSEVKMVENKSYVGATQTEMWGSGLPGWS